MRFKFLNISQKYILITIAGILLFACGSENEESTEVEENTKPVIEEVVAEYGVGPVQYVDTSQAIDPLRVEKGEEIFKGKCMTCHRMNSRMIGPDLSGVTDRRNPAWIMNMIINPEEMVKKDPIAKQLLKEYLSPMLDQNISEEEARNLLEYLRSYDKK